MTNFLNNFKTIVKTTITTFVHYHAIGNITISLERRREFERLERDFWQYSHQPESISKNGTAALPTLESLK